MHLSTCSLIQFTQLINSLVWDCHTGQLLGTVQQIWIDKELHQVLGLTYQSLLNSSEQRSLPWEQVLAVSPEGAWSDISESTALIFQPKSSIHYQLGEEVWTNSGAFLGTLVDYCFETNTGEILSYQCVASDHKGRVSQVVGLSAEDLSYSKDRFLIELTENLRSPKQLSQQTIVGMAFLPIESKPSSSFNSSHQDTYFYPTEFNLARTPQHLETKNLVAS